MIRKKVVIVASIVVVLLGAGFVTAWSMGWFSHDSTPSTPQAGGNTSDAPADSMSEQDKALQQMQNQVSDFVRAGDDASIEKADEVVEKQQKQAEESKNEGYIVSTKLAKADLLIDTGRVQQAFDEILFPLERKYTGNPTYIYNVYGLMSKAYRYIGDTTKAEEYFSKMPGEGWDFAQ